MTTQLDFKAFAQQIRAKAKDYPIDASSYDPKASFSTVTPQGTTWTVRCGVTSAAVEELAGRVAKGAPDFVERKRYTRPWKHTSAQVVSKHYSLWFNDLKAGWPEFHFFARKPISFLLDFERKVRAAVLGAPVTGYTTRDSQGRGVSHNRVEQEALLDWALVRAHIDFRRSLDA